MLKRGSVVVSSAGKDQGTFLVVVRVEPDGVWVADGRRRSLERPKRKNPRHVAATPFTADEASMATNRELRRVLRAAYEKAAPSNAEPPDHHPRRHHMREVI